MGSYFFCSLKKFICGWLCLGRNGRLFIKGRYGRFLGYLVLGYLILGRKKQVMVNSRKVKSFYIVVSFSRQYRQLWSGRVVVKLGQKEVFISVAFVFVLVMCYFLFCGGLFWSIVRFESFFITGRGTGSGGFFKDGFNFRVNFQRRGQVRGVWFFFFWCFLGRVRSKWYLGRGLRFGIFYVVN